MTAWLLGAPAPLVAAAGGLAGGYLVGTLPVASLLVPRDRREAVRQSTGYGGRRLPGSIEVLLAGGLRIGLLTLVLELLKGAGVGLGARLYDGSAWFDATAIAGCVAGDAFPVLGRRGRRGVAPLVSGLIVALPGAWIAGVVIALPAALLLGFRGGAYDLLVAVTVPLALVLGTGDTRTLWPAALIVVVLVARNRLRRQARARALAEWRRSRERGAPEIIDQAPGGPPPSRGGGVTASTRHTTPPA